jgi:ribosomal protein S18 acetylase RimI-like enzyme
MSRDLGRALRFMAELEDRMASRRVELPFGAAVFNDALPRVWYQNFVRVERDAPLAEVVRATERLQAEAGLVHRKVEVRLDAVGARYARDSPWEPTRLVVMAHRGEPPPVDERAEEVDAGTLVEKWRAGIRASPTHDGDEETVRQLVEAQLLRETATSVRYFSAQADGVWATECSLFSDGRTAQVESVETLEPYRRRGLARAAVARAVTEAYAAGHDFVFLLADEDDWPKELYRKLGFEEVGRVWELLRKPASDAARASPRA